MWDDLKKLFWHTGSARVKWNANLIGVLFCLSCGLIGIAFAMYYLLTNIDLVKVIVLTSTVGFGLLVPGYFFWKKHNFAGVLSMTVLLEGSLLWSSTFPTIGSEINVFFASTCVYPVVLLEKRSLTFSFINFVFCLMALMVTQFFFAPAESVTQQIFMFLVKFTLMASFFAQAYAIRLLFDKGTDEV